MKKKFQRKENHMFNAFRAARHMPALKCTPVGNPTEAVTSMALDLKKQTLDWLEMRKNETTQNDGGAPLFSFRKNLYGERVEDSIPAKDAEPGKYTVFLRVIDLENNNEIATTISRANVTEEEAFGMMDTHEKLGQLRKPDSPKLLFPDRVSEIRTPPPGYGYQDAALKHGIEFYPPFMVGSVRKIGQTDPVPGITGPA
jgi:hypothetical protein